MTEKSSTRREVVLSTKYPQRAGVRFARIPGFPDSYAIGTDGSVWSHRTVYGHSGQSWRQLACVDWGNGYLYVSLGKKITRSVHRLVLAAFRGPAPSAKHVARHRNGIRGDNCLRNLVWSTQRENLADREKHGTSLRGARNGSAKLTASIVRTCRKQFKKGNLNVKEATEKYGVCAESLRRAIRGDTWSHI